MAQKRRLWPLMAQPRRRRRSAGIAQGARKKPFAAMLRAGHDYADVRFILDAAGEAEVDAWLDEAVTGKEARDHGKVLADCGHGGPGGLFAGRRGDRAGAGPDAPLSDAPVRGEDGITRPSVSGLQVIDLVVMRGDQRLSFKVELAASEAAQARGLMFREELGDDEGMLFPSRFRPSRAASG